MSLSAAVIDALVAAGCTVEQLAAAVKADLAQGDAKAADKRAKDAERQRKSRHNRILSHNVTVTPCDRRDSPPLDKEIPPTPPKEIKPPYNPPVISNEMTAPIAAELDDEDKPLTPAEVVADWNDLAAELDLPRVEVVSDKRRRALSCRIKQFTLPQWQRAFANIRGSPFCLGDNPRGWRANLDFLLIEANFIKLLEGAYDGKAKSTH